MKTSTTPACTALRTWLIANLGRGATAALTGTDYMALAAAVHVLELMTTAGRTHRLIDAFRGIVLEMQPSTRYFAYHAIAHVMDWHDRETLWEQAGFLWLPNARFPECEHAPQSERVA